MHQNKLFGPRLSKVIVLQKNRHRLTEKVPQRVIAAAAAAAAVVVVVVVMGVHYGGRGNKSPRIWGRGH